MSPLAWTLRPLTGRGTEPVYAFADRGDHLGEHRRAAPGVVHHGVVSEVLPLHETEGKGENEEKL